MIESIVGKGKRLLGTSQNNNSLTGQILSIAARTKELSAGAIEESLRRCRIKDLRAWVQANVSRGIHVPRREDLTAPPEGVKLAQGKSAAIPNF